MHCDRPDCEATDCRLARIERLLQSVEQRTKNIMAAIDDLNAAVAAQSVEIGVIGQAVTDEVTRVNDALAALPTNNDPAIEAAVATITASTANLATAATALAAVAAASPAPVATAPVDPPVPTA